MCGRRGSTLTVCAWPMWLVSPISVGFAGSVTSMISSPPRGAPEAPRLPLSWQRPGSVAGVEQQLGLAAVGLQHVGVEDHVALRRGLHVVLEAGGRGGHRGAGGGGMLCDHGGLDRALVGELHDRLAAAVGRGAEQAHRGVGLAAAGEVVEVAVGVAGDQRGQEVPVRTGSARVEVGAQRLPGRHEAGRRVVQVVGDGERRAGQQARPRLLRERRCGSCDVCLPASTTCWRGPCPTLPYATASQRRRAPSGRVGGTRHLRCTRRRDPARRTPTIPPRTAQRRPRRHARRCPASMPAVHLDRHAVRHELAQLGDALRPSRRCRAGRPSPGSPSCTAAGRSRRPASTAGCTGVPGFSTRPALQPASRTAFSA